MQYNEYNTILSVGFAIVIVISYILVRMSSKSNERFRECGIILLIGILVEQICALYYGIQLENVVDFYLNTTAVFGPVAVLLILDLVIQRLQFQQHPKRSPRPITIELE